MHPFPTSADHPDERNEQLPLGEHPSYDDLLDVAVQYTFPCSDPIAVDGCCIEKERERAEGAPLGPGHGAGHGEALPL